MALFLFGLAVALLSALVGLSAFALLAGLPAPSVQGKGPAGVMTFSAVCFVIGIVIMIGGAINWAVG